MTVPHDATVPRDAAAPQDAAPQDAAPQDAAPYDLRAFRCRSDNVGVLLRCRATGAVAAIDAPEAGAVLGALEAARWRLTDVLVTHRHPDHVEGLAALRAAHGARVTAPAAARAEVPADRYVGDGDAVGVGDLAGVALATPGHCRDHLAFHFAGVGLLFAGDLLFVMGCGRPGDGAAPEVLHASLGRLAALPGATRAFVGHDYTASNARFALGVDPDNEALRARAAEAEERAARGELFGETTLERERATNPFLRPGDPAIRARLGLEGASDAAVFAALRERKNRA